MHTESRPSDRPGGHAAPRNRGLRLERFVALGVPLVGAFGVLYAVAALRLGSFALLGASLVCFSYLAALLVARRVVVRGNAERGAQIAAHGCQAMTLAGTLFVPFLYPALAMLPLTAAAIVLPHLSGAKLRAVCVLTLVVSAWVVVACGFLPPAFEPPPEVFSSLLGAANVLAVAVATLLLLVLDASALRSSLRELAASERLLLEESRRKDEFLAMLGHELRNPLAPILSSVALMRSRGAGGRELDVVERQARHVARLVDDLLDVSRITRGRIELRRETLRASEVLSRGIEIARPSVEAGHHDLRVEVEEDALVLGDPVRLAQVVGNLVTNAARYTPPGGRILARVRREGETALLSVSDDGRGVHPSMRERIFDLFEQGARPLDRADGGLGIGLTVVRRLVELHGGSVSVESEGEGRGSTFTVSLPSTPAPPVAPTRLSERAERLEPVRISRGATPGLRLLVVDDNVDAAEILAETLRTLGHEVRVAHEGEGAISAARDLRPDVVLLDLGLPGMNGFEVARVLLRGERPPRVVAVTGYGQASDRARTAEAGFFAHLVKPVDIEQLAELLGPERKAA